MASLDTLSTILTCIASIEAAILIAFQILEVVRKRISRHGVHVESEAEGHV